MQTVAQFLAQTLMACDNCRKSQNLTWLARHDAAARNAVRDYLPSGSGWDNGTTLDHRDGDRFDGVLRFAGAFHHMDENGGYNGWTDHRVTVRASLAFGLDIAISGRNRNDVKDDLRDRFAVALEAEMTQAMRNACYGREGS